MTVACDARRYVSIASRRGSRLVGGHDAAIGEGVQDDGNSVVVRCMVAETVDPWCDAGGEVLHHAQHVAVAAQRHDVGDLVADGVASGGNDCQPS